MTVILAVSACSPSAISPASPTGAPSPSSAVLVDPTDDNAHPSAEPEKPPPDHDPSAAARLTAGLRTELNEDDVDAVVEILARAGIEVYSDADNRLAQGLNGPPFVLRLWRYQAGNMAGEIHHGGGDTGHRLNALLTNDEPEVDFPISLLLAIYVAHADTFGGEVSRQLMGDISLDDHAELAYPRLVQMLFVRDAFGSNGDVAHAARPFASISRTALLDVGGACQTAREKLDRLPDLLAGLIPTGSGILGWVSAAAKATVSAATRALIDSLLAAVRSLLGPVPVILAKLSVVVYLASLLDPWQFSFSAAPAALHYQVDGLSSGGPVRTTASGTLVPYFAHPLPDAITKCAALLELPVPEPQKVEGSSVSWDDAGLAGHASGVGGETQVAGANGMITYTFEARSETANDHNFGSSASATAALGVTVERPADPAKFRAFIVAAFNLPGALASLASGFLAKLVTHLLTKSDTVHVDINYHRDPPPASFSYVEDGVTIEGHNCEGVYGQWTVRMTASNADAVGQGMATMSVAPGGATTVTWSFPITLIGHDGETQQAAYVGSLSGNASGSGQSAVLDLHGAATITPPGMSAPYDVTIPVTLGSVGGCP